MNALTDFHFLRPLWLLALAALPLIGFWWRHQRRDAGAWHGAVDAHLLPHLLEAGDDSPRNGGLWLAAGVWLIACLALSGPAWEREPLPLYRNEAARILALELAPSMLAEDVKPSRLQRARFKLDDILNRSRDMQTALIGYAGDAFIAAPLTDDAGTVRNLVGALDPSVMPIAGNATARAIEVALQLLHQAGLEQGQLILLADSVGPDAVAAARAAHAAGLNVSVLGIGSEAGAPVPLGGGGFLKNAAGNIVLPKLDPVALRAVADAGGGRYATLTPDASDLATLLAEPHAALGTVQSAEENAAVSTRFRDRGPWLVLLLLPLALVGFRRGWLMALVLVLIVPVPRAQAFSFGELWQRPDQQAAAALVKGDARRALAVARDPAWRGSAAYRAGDYQAASAAWAKAAGAAARYNEGNALARLGRYRDAIAAYDRALTADPGLADAQANKRAVEDWLKQQPEPQQQDQQEQSKDDRQGGSRQQPPGAQQPPSQQGQQQQPDRQANPADAGSAGNTKHKPAVEDRSRENGTQKQNEPAPDQGDSSEPSAAVDRMPSAQQQQALSQALDRALAKNDNEGKKERAAVGESEADQERRQALDQWLERIPDDPGGLLRRKFLLEYQRRQQNGGDGE